MQGVEFRNSIEPVREPAGGVLQREEDAEDLHALGSGDGIGSTEPRARAARARRGGDSRLDGRRRGTRSESETAGRRGRAEDGVAQTREAKAVTFQAMQKDGKGRFRMCERRVDAAIESASTPDVSRDPSPFARRVRWWATACGYDRARVQVVVADGAPWIWKLWEELFPNAVQILDLYHVRERLRGVANARFGGGNPEAKERQLWWRRRHPLLRRGKLPALLEELDAMAVAAGSSAELKRVASECAPVFATIASAWTILAIAGSACAAPRRRWKACASISSGNA